MKKIQIFDPAMCCATGVCGPAIDPELLRVATVINTLQGKGVDISRHGLSNDPMAFITDTIINDLLQKEGAEILPVTLVNGQIAKTKIYPTNQEFAEWSGIEL